MKKLLLFTFICLKSFGQTTTWTFPIPANSIQYSTGTSAPIVPTSDGGFILNYAYSYPNWDVALGYQSTIIKTDSNFVPLWSKKLTGSSGKKTIVLPDGYFLFFTDLGTLLKLDSNGQALFSIGNFAVYPERFSISDAELIGNTIKIIGTKDLYNGFGYITSSSQLMVDFDLNGNVLQTYVLEDGGTSAWTRPTNISKDNSGNYYITGYSYTDGNYICKINSSNTVLWCKRFKHTNNYSIISVNDILPLTNGDILLAGSFYNYSTSFGGMYLNRLSSDGALLSANTNTNYTSSINSITQLPNGDIVGAGGMRENDNALNKTFSMRMDSDETLSWLKLYNDGFGISVPYVKEDNNWYYTAFHNNNTDNNNPILFNTENTGNTNCANDDLTLTFTDIPLLFNSTTLTMTTTPSVLEIPSTLPTSTTQTQDYIDQCIARFLGLNEAADKNEVQVYPNPSKGIIQITSKSEIKSIEISNALGQNMKNHYPNLFETSIQIDSNGMYLIKITTETGIKNTKVIISN